MQHKTSSRSTGTHSAFDPRLLGDVKAIPIVLERALNDLATTDAEARFVRQVCDVTDRLNSGRYWSYQPNDLRYHDYQHTLQAAWAYLDLVAGLRLAEPDPAPLTPREAALGFAAIMLHDTGYLKTKGDDTGIGAKYTQCHVLRSCALAASILPTFGCVKPEVDDIIGAIRCTGLSGNPAAANFGSEHARTIACMVATADYLGQMAAPEYPDKLPSLFDEFAEADEFNGVPIAQRQFTSLAQLLAATPAFWAKFVQPKLERDFGGVHRFMRAARPDAPNPYFTAIEENLAILARRHPAGAA
ncbi:MAG: hypothetical protein MUE42_01695 [Opitutaceae bacterium]|nr:hypothetical protein [Opitutaceae bacterium]